MPKRGKPHYKNGQKLLSLGHQRFPGETLINFTHNGKGLYLLKGIVAVTHLFDRFVTRVHYSWK